MLMPENIDPKKSIYYTGAMVLQLIQRSCNISVLNLYSEVKSQYGISFPVMLLSLAACGAGTKTIRISTTTSVNDSGLLGYLLPYFKEATGYEVDVQSAGTGAAIQKAMDGNADLILVHSKASEEKFVADGYGVERIPFMYNYFVIAGPADDPAGIADSANAAEAFAKIGISAQYRVTPIERSILVYVPYSLLSEEARVNQDHVQLKFKI